MLTSIVPLPTQNTKPILDCKFDPCGRNLVTASQDGHCHLYDTASARSGGGEVAPAAVFKAHEGPILTIDFGPLAFGRPCVTGGLDRSVRVWKLAPGFPNQWQPLYTDNSHKGPVTCVAFSQSPGSPPTAYQSTALSANHPVGLHLASGSRDGSVTIHSLLVDHSWSRKSFVAHAGGVKCLRWATSETPRTTRMSTDPTTMLGPSYRLVTGGADGTVRIWALEQTTGEFVNEATLTGHHTGIRDVAWRPNHDSPRDVVVSLGVDGSLIFWTSEGTQRNWRLHQRMHEKIDEAERLSWSLDGALLGVSVVSKSEAPVRVIREGPERGMWEECHIPAVDFIAKSPHVSFHNQPSPSLSGAHDPSNLYADLNPPHMMGHTNPLMSQPMNQPPSMMGQSASMMNQPPSMMNQPPSMMGQPPSMMGQPPSMMGQPPSMMGQPPSMMGPPPSMMNSSMNQPPSMMVQPPQQPPSMMGPPPMMGQPSPPGQPMMGQSPQQPMPPLTPVGPPPYGATPSTLPPSMMSSPSGMMPNYRAPPPPSAYRPF